MQKRPKKINDDGAVFFFRKVPLHPREKLARANKKTKDYDAVFLRQVLLNPRERLARATRKNPKR